MSMAQIETLIDELIHGVRIYVREDGEYTGAMDGSSTPPDYTHITGPRDDLLAAIAALSGPPQVEAGMVELEKIADFWEPHWRGAGIKPTADWLIAEIKAYSEARPREQEGGEAPVAFDPATSPGMTDMMVAPETLDAFMEANPLPANGWREGAEAMREAAAKQCERVAGPTGHDFACAIRSLPTPPASTEGGADD